MSDKLSVTFSPHLQDRASISSLTYLNLAALGPAILVGLYFFGLRALIIFALSAATAVATEALLQKVMGREITIRDGTAALTGLLLAMLLPAGTPWWAVMVGSAVAIFLGKHLYGGLGCNPFNAVIVGWVVMQLSWPNAVGIFYEPVSLSEGLWGKLYPLDPSEMPLAIMAFGDAAGVKDMYQLWPSLIGGIPGGIGSTSVIALAVGGLFLIIRRVITWQIPVGFLGGLLIFGLIFWLVDPSGQTYANPFHQLIYGYTLIGAFFLATDQATSPYTGFGALFYGLGIGVLTMIIRYWGAHQDGVLFAILFMNALTPMLDRIRFRSYGRVQAAI